MLNMIVKTEEGKEMSLEFSGSETELMIELNKKSSIKFKEYYTREEIKIDAKDIKSIQYMI